MDLALGFAVLLWMETQRARKVRAHASKTRLLAKRVFLVSVVDEDVTGMRLVAAAAAVGKGSDCDIVVVAVAAAHKADDTAAGIEAAAKARPNRALDPVAASSSWHHTPRRRPRSCCSHRTPEAEACCADCFPQTTTRMRSVRTADSPPARSCC